VSFVLAVVADILLAGNAQTLTPLTGALLFVSYTVIVTGSPACAEAGAFIASTSLAGITAIAVGVFVFWA
jgi:hypothetical protein